MATTTLAEILRDHLAEWDDLKNGSEVRIARYRQFRDEQENKLRAEIETLQRENAHLKAKIRRIQLGIGTGVRRHG